MLMRSLTSALALLLASTLVPQLSVAQTFLVSSDQGELVEIDLEAETATELGQADVRLTDIAMNQAGELYAVSRHRNEDSETSHLYRLNPENGMIIEEIGDTGVARLSDIDFCGDILLANIRDGREGPGELGEINLATGDYTPLGRFGGELRNGGLTVSPAGEVWVGEALAVGASLFQVNRLTGERIGALVELEDSVDGLEFLNDGRLFGAEADGSDLFFINVNTGEITPFEPTEIGDINSINGITDRAGPECLLPPVEEEEPPGMPASGPLGLGLMMVLLLSASAWLLRRQRA